MVLLPLRGEWGDQKGLCKPITLAISLCTTKTTGFSGSEMPKAPANRCQKILQIQPGALSSGMAISYKLRAGNREMKLRKGKCEVRSSKHSLEWDLPAAEIISLGKRHRVHHFGNLNKAQDNIEGTAHADGEWTEVPGGISLALPNLLWFHIFYHTRK